MTRKGLRDPKRRILKWYGHVTRQAGLAKTILQGTVQGGRRRSRQRKRWEDNFKELTGLEWNTILPKAENREEWRELVVKSTVVPKRSVRLRDRWDESMTRTETVGFDHQIYRSRGQRFTTRPARRSETEERIHEGTVQTDEAVSAVIRLRVVVSAVFVLPALAPTAAII